MNHAESDLLLYIDADGADAGERDVLARQLLAELRELDVTAVPATAAHLPPGTKSIGAIDFGGLAVTLLPSMAPKVIELVQGWLSRRQEQTVKIKYTIQDRSVEVEHPHTMSAEKLQSLVQTVTLALQQTEANPTTA